MDDDLDGVIANIRACLVSSKGPVTLRNLISDYETLVGTNIPYHKFNYDRLEAFLQSFSSLNVIGSGRDALVEARRDSTSSHISSLVAKQKPAKRKEYIPSSRRGTSYRQSSYGRTRGYPQRSHAPRETLREAQNVRKPPMYVNQAPDYKGNESVGPIVVKLDGNDKRQVNWNPNTGSMSVTIKT